MKKIMPQARTLKTLKVVLASSALLLSSAALTVNAMQSEHSDAGVFKAPTQLAESNRIIVKYKNSVQEGQVSALSSQSIQALSSVAGTPMNYLRKIGTGAHVMKLEEKVSTSYLQSVVQKLQADPNVEYAEIDRKMYIQFTPNDSRYNEQWHYFENTGGLNVDAAWDVTQGQGVNVAVLDTGYRPHADLNDNLVGGYDMIGDLDTAQDGNGRDSDARDPGDWSPAGLCTPFESPSSWHGTHVAGTIAAETNNGTGVAGVAYRSKVVSIRVLGRCGGFTSDIADGIIWGAGGNVSGVPSNSNPAKVLNLSLGGGGSCGSTTQNAINIARSLGSTVIVAAGNSNINASNATPANCNGVITVAATDRQGNRASYSNYGSVVDVAAPGGETANPSNGVLSTLNSGSRGPGSDSYAFYQGTSMATPHVAGVAALMYSVNPSITPDEVESILKSTSRSFPGNCSQCGSGIVDAAAAVAAANGNPPTGGINETNLSGNRGTWRHYSIDVSSGASSLAASISGGSGDADLYVRYGSRPTTSSYNCRPYLNGNNESCNFNNPQAGTWWVSIRAYSTYSGVNLVAN